MRGLPRHQRLGMAGAIEQQIGLEIFRDIVGDGIDPVDHGIDDAVGKPRQRHGQGIDDLLLRIPFRAMASAISLAGATTWRPEGVRIGLPSSVTAKPSVRLGDAGVRVKALALRHARGAPHRLLRIERRLSGDFVEQFTHAVFGFRLSVLICAARV